VRGVLRAVLARPFKRCLAALRGASVAVLLLQAVLLQAVLQAIQALFKTLFKSRYDLLSIPLAIMIYILFNIPIILVPIQVERRPTFRDHHVDREFCHSNATLYCLNGALLRCQRRLAISVVNHTKVVDNKRCC